MAPLWGIINPDFVMLQQKNYVDQEIASYVRHCENKANSFFLWAIIHIYEKLCNSYLCMKMLSFCMRAHAKYMIFIVLNSISSLKT